ncbi:MAG: YggS family pyridoxal phosphate-dependent enzyme [Filimonas sp.]|nr:YggS family pyridoxal phosphate-dependent enzyme [Filimonas sp.]
MNNTDEAVIKSNLAFVKQRIYTACAKAGRPPEDVRLLLATKTVPAEKIQIAIDAGETLIGENKVQELNKKIPLLTDSHKNIHFIGHLQSNKIKDVLKYADCIESVDRLSLAEALNKKLATDNRTIDIFIQVNTSFEESKFGVHPDEALSLIKAVNAFPHLRIKGLMTIGLFDADHEKVRPSFSLLRQIRDASIAQSLLAADAKELSMGMSGDMETAIAEGATIVRVGTAIFGKRMYPDSYYWNEQRG